MVANKEFGRSVSHDLYGPGLGKNWKEELTHDWMQTFPAIGTSTVHGSGGSQKYSSGIASTRIVQSCP